MSVTVSASRRSSAAKKASEYGGLSLEAEIRSLYSLAPSQAAQLPTLFADSVVKSCNRVLGDNSGEALVRRVGDHRLTDPAEVYSKIDSLLLGGAEALKKAIRRSFRADVHRLYMVTMELKAPVLRPD